MEQASRRSSPLPQTLPRPVNIKSPHTRQLQPAKATQLTCLALSKRSPRRTYLSSLASHRRSCSSPVRSTFRPRQEQILAFQTTIRCQERTSLNLGPKTVANLARLSVTTALLSETKPSLQPWLRRSYKRRKASKRKSRRRKMPKMPLQSHLVLSTHQDWIA